MQVTNKSTVSKSLLYFFFTGVTLLFILTGFDDDTGSGQVDENNDCNANQAAGG